jgi:urease accessory protein
MHTERPSSGPFDWLPGLLQTADPLFPTGAYAHSGGLEELVRLDVVTGETTLRAHLLGRIAGTQTHLELPFVRECGAAARANDLDLLAALDADFESRKASAEARAAGRTLGRRRLAALRAIVPDARLQDYTSRIARGAAPGQAVAVAGLQAAADDTPEEAMLFAHYYLSGAGACSAALKLLRIGQDAIQRLLRAFVAAGPACIAASREIPLAAASWFDPALEIAAMRHEHADERLFIS